MPTNSPQKPCHQKRVLLFFSSAPIFKLLPPSPYQVRWKSSNHPPKGCFDINLIKLRIKSSQKGGFVEARSAQEIWEAALGALQLEVSKPNYKTWLNKTVGLGLRGSQFVVGVPNAFAAEYLDKNQRSMIEKTLIAITGRNLNALFQVNSRNSATEDETFTPRQTTTSRLNPKYTFSSFIEGRTNRLAYAAALEVAQNPGRSHNPLFIYGGVGLGKTHLLHAIGHVAQANHLQVLYASAERFTNEFITAIRERKTEEFRTKYRSVDMLLIDDIHFLGGKEQTEESFFYTFDELHNANRQIAITSNRHPKSIPQLQDRLRSRFQWGLIADIKPPDFETRLAILQAKAKQKSVTISLDVLEFIARWAQQNIRELEGSLNRVIAYANLVRALPTVEIAAQALEDIAGKQPGTTTPELVIEAVANSFQLTTIELKSQKRDRQTALARQVVMYLIRQETDYSLAQIGQALGGKIPATVSHACEKIASEINSSPYLQRKISRIQQKIHAEPKSGC